MTRSSPSPDFRASTSALQASGRTVQGYVCVWDVPYPIGGGLLESMSPGSVQYDDLELTLGHDVVDAQGRRLAPAPVLAAVRSGTLTVRSDDVGLYVQAELDPTDPDAASALAKLGRGDVRGLSVGMYVLEDAQVGGVRQVQRALGFQASLVGRPANPAAEAELRAAAGQAACPTCGKFQDLGRTDPTCQHCSAALNAQAAEPPAEEPEAKPEAKAAETPAEAPEAGLPAPMLIPYAPAPYDPWDMDDSVVCPACERLNAPDATWCDQCGTALPGGPAESYQAEADETVVCPVCGCFNDSDAAFCDQDGTKLIGRTDVFRVAADQRAAATPTPTPKPNPPAETRRAQHERTTMGTELIASLREKRETLATEIDTIVLAQTSGAEVRELSAEESATLANRQAQVKTLDARIAELTEAELRAESARKTAASLGAGPSGIRVTNEPATYRKGGYFSFFADLARTAAGFNPQAAERLGRHMAEMRDLTRTDGAGGYFVPPAWLVEEFAPYLRAGRVTANLCQAYPLPGKTDSINIPRITTGTAVASQADNGSVTQTDIVDNFIAAPVITLAGQESLAMQLIDQSPVAFDSIIMQDLAASLAQQVDLQVLSGSGSGGNVKGILTAVPAGNQVAYTSASPTVPLLYSKIADAVQRIQTSRFAAPNAVVMHPRRWAYLLAAVDSSSRPLVTPYAAFNPVASPDGLAPQGVVGSIMGMSVYTDANIPTNLGAGTNQDTILIGKMDDAMLFEGSLQTRALPQPKASTLEILIQAYEYLAFTAERFDVGFASIGGTGLIAPTF